MSRFWYFTIILSMVTFMLSSFTWMSLPVTKQEKYIERYTKKDSEDTPNEKSFKSYYLDLGRGESTIMLTPTNQVILIDVGNVESFNKLSFILQELGITTIDFLFITTNEIDHSGALPELAKKIAIKNLFISKSMTEGMEDNVKQTISKMSNVITMSDGKKIHIEDQVEIVAYFENPLVLSIRHNEITYLHMSDGNFETEEELIKKYPKHIKAHILKVGNHGQSLTCSDEFIKTVNPQVAIILGGDREDNNRPSYGVLERLTESWIDVYQNDVKGTILITSDGAKYDVKTHITAY
ncbi:hypothetical protein BHU72_08295 [Desulfuribacillus stibiiarsenatis]|uniref:Metallo-beta-lactamase domain-containing protein n=1 Tax=Desulfuribacillus stibiiarsenatis TaxID=1390249 RepID=A0A1E5L3Z9_9FIRM|nr:MBL fold metallo-hydrolase [Desulfuribacillus stibiiarsenatis]OEH84821.1 hypothetical protein BHU72_08295 [Desulfuribacillus stibiiarsenatis]